MHRPHATSAFPVARDSFISEGNSRRRDFAILPPGHRCGHFDAKTVLEEEISSRSAGGLSRLPRKQQDSNINEMIGRDAWITFP